MRWDVIIDAWLGLATADSVVQSVLGTSPEIWMAGEREHEVPSLEWSLISDTEGENWEVTGVQLDPFVRSIADLTTLEGALRRLLHHDTPITAGTHELWSQLTGGGPLPGLDDGIIGRHIDFRLTYLRGRYVA